MNTLLLDVFLKEAELQKEALVPETVGAVTRLLKGREAGQQAAHAVRSAIKRKVHRPTMRAAWKGISKIEAPATRRLRAAGGSKMPTTLQKKLMRGTKTLVDNPEIIPMQAVPIPGTTPAWVPLKKGLRKGLSLAYA
jgi:hypothetical protein